MYRLHYVVSSMLFRRRVYSYDTSGYLWIRSVPRVLFFQLKNDDALFLAEEGVDDDDYNIYRRLKIDLRIV